MIEITNVTKSRLHGVITKTVFERKRPKRTRVVLFNSEYGYFSDSNRGHYEFVQDINDAKVFTNISSAKQTDVYKHISGTEIIEVRIKECAR